MTPPATPTVTPEMRRALIGLAVAVHIAFVVAPLDVLDPVSAHDIGRRLLSGETPYTELAVEYPPLTLALFLIPGAVGAALGPSALAVQALALEAVMWWVLLAGQPSPGDRVARAAVASTLVFPFLSGGVDAAPMAAIGISVALVAGGHRAGWWVAAAGAAAKLVPAQLWVWRRPTGAAGWSAAVVGAAVALAPVAWVGTDDRSWVGWSLHRGTHIESVAGSIRWLADQVGVGSFDPVYEYRSWQVAATAVGVIVGLMAASVLAWLAWRARRSAIDPWLATFAAVGLILAGSKVLSPQFIAWLAPAAVMAGRRIFTLWAAAAALTLVAFAGPGGPDGFLAVIAVRNAVLVTSVAVALRQLADPGPEPIDLSGESVEVA